MASRSVLLIASLSLFACEGGGLPIGHHETPDGMGPTVIWDLEAEPLPEIPLPNDVATWPDPSSPTGRRINASLIAPSGMERRLRQEFDRLDGWGTFAPLTLRFDAPLDTEELLRRQGRGEWGADAWPEHAIYLIDVETGIPVPLDIGSGLFPRVVAETDGYYENDPHEDGSNLLFETVAEDVNGNGALDPGEDTDFDGVLDFPNTRTGELAGTPHETVDEMLWFYERETSTLMVRPILPLEGGRQYIAVLTNRLVGEDGQSVRSPFPWVHHIGQNDDLASLPAILSERPDLYGDLAADGWEGVAFAWSFTTQSIGADLNALREGLYGRGPFARLAEEFPPTLIVSPVRGGTRTEPCDPGPIVYRVTPAEFTTAFEGLPVDGFGVPGSQLDAVLSALEESIAYMVFGFFESPYLLGDPDAENLNDTWQIDRRTGEARVSRDLVPMFILVPKETEAHQQPFETTLYAHGYTSLNIEALAFAAQVANHGVATVAIDAQGHGIPLGDDLRPLLEAVLGSNCLAPLGSALSIDRARDLDGDGTADNGGFFFSAYMFHTRDTLRQTVVDWFQATRIVRSWFGHPDYPEGRPWEAGTIEPGGRAAPLEFTGDVDGDGAIDLAGDFDGDGVADLGGWDTQYGQWGSSLGGIVSMLNIGNEPAIQAAAPVSGGGGLFDITMRTDLSTGRDPIWLRVLGPVIASRTSAGPDARTACEAGDRSLFFHLPILNSDMRTEFACVPEETLGEGDALILVNARNGEVRCTGVGAEGRFRITVPTDVGDPLILRIYEDARDTIDYATCTFTGETPRLLDTIDTWRSANGARDLPGTCSTCAAYLGQVFEAGSRLTAPIEGLGLERQSPDLRRLAGLGQIAMDPADPINFARRIFLDPVTASDVGERGARSILVMNTAGDVAVPPSSANAYARAAGILAFMPPDAPDDFADWRAPTRVFDTWGVPTPDDILIDYHVSEGLARMERHPVEGAPQFVFDVDDMSEGRQFFAPRGNRQLAEAEGGLRPNRLDPPLRWGRESRPAAMAGFDPWSTEGTFAGTSVVLTAMAVPNGQHVLLPVDPTKVFDEGEYLVNVIGWYLASHGTELPWVVLPDPFCLESSSCSR